MFRRARLVLFAQGSATVILAFTSLLSSAQNPRVPRDIQTLPDGHQYAEAEQALQRELQRTPDWDVGHLLLAQIYSATGRYEPAERSALAALRRRESVDGFLALAVATMHLARLNESIGWLEKAAKRQPDNPEIYKVLGLDYALGGNLVECETAFRRAAQLAPQNWEFHYLHGRALYELRLYPESEKVLRRGVGWLRYDRSKPHGEPIPHAAGVLPAPAGVADAYAALGETDRAIAEMKRALRADTDGSMHYRLGRWYQKNGQSREAAEAFAASTRLKAEKLKHDTERFTALQPAD